MKLLRNLIRYWRSRDHVPFVVRTRDGAEIFANQQEAEDVLFVRRILQGRDPYTGELK